MAPKKEAKKADDLSPEDKMAQELQTLEGEKADLSIELTFLKEKLHQAKVEHERLRQEIDVLKLRLAKSTQDAADILEHREAQIKANEGRVHALQQHRESLEKQIAQLSEQLQQVKVANEEQADKLEDVASLLKSKEELESAVHQQAELINRQEEELQGLKEQLQERDKMLAEKESAIQELTLRSSGTTELRILFNEPWMIHVRHYKLKGDVPFDREGHAVQALNAGKVLVLCGGHGRHDGLGREVALLNLESQEWERPIAARMSYALVSHSCATVGRTKLIMFGGLKNDMPSSDMSLFNVEAMKWTLPHVKGQHPPPRVGHSMAAVRERLFAFGGQTEAGLSNDIWVFDQESLQWTQVLTFGELPSARTGASLCASEDGRRLWLFGGNDGQQSLNDVYMLETERLAWTQVAFTGRVPEPREHHAVATVSRFMVISGGIQVGADGSVKRLADTMVMDLASPMWEMIEDGAWATSLLWLKHGSTYSTLCGNRLFTVKPDREELLSELQVTEFCLPEHIEELKAANKKDDFREELSLLDNAVCGTNFIELEWRPPSRNANRIEKFKLMMATSSGVVKEVCQGSYMRWRVTGLRASMEYIFCVKAVYEDGSHLWSESKSFHTKATALS